MTRNILLAALLAVGVAGCGGGDEAEPLTLQQRQPTAADTQGYEQDPVEVGEQTNDLTVAIEALHDKLRAATPDEATEVFEQAGFRAALSDVLFRPVNPGGPHSGERPHLAFLVAQFESEDGAREVVDFLVDDGRRPCPGACADRISEFDVDGIPDAKTVRRVATKQRIEAFGAEGQRPQDSYVIAFADGDFAYVVESFGPPGSVSEAQAERLAKSLYDRVKGAPPPE